MRVIEILQKETYLSVLLNAPGTKMFRCLWALTDSGKEDLLDDGKKACAVFASSVLFLFGLAQSRRATVDGFERDLIASGWKKAAEPVSGDVIFWEPRMQAGHRNKHVGFYICRDMAVSTDWNTGSVRAHHMTYGVKKRGKNAGNPVRRITAIYTHDFLRKK